MAQISYTTQTRQQNEYSLADSYFDISGIACTVVPYKNDANFAHGCPSDISCFCNAAPEFYKMLCALDSQGKPYILHCSSMLAFFVVRAHTPSGETLFIGGPVLPTGFDSAEPCPHLNGGSQLPSFSSLQLIRQAQLLYDIVKLQYPAPVPQHTNVLPVPVEDFMGGNRMHPHDFSIENKAETLHTNNKLKKNVAKILQFAKEGKYEEARQALQDYSIRIYKSCELQFAKSVLLKIAYTCSLTVADSSDFTYTKKMLLICGQYAELLYSTPGGESIQTAIETFAGNFVLELKTTGAAMQTMRISEKIIHYIAQNPGANLSLAAIAEALNFNISYISRVFKAETGMTIKHYVVICRVEKAFEYILSTDQSIAEIAAAAGFSSSKLFRKHFVAHYGVSPSALRSAHMLSNVTISNGVI